MFALLFRNRWFAAGYVALTLVSASLFVGRDGGAERLAQTTKQLQAQRALLSKPVRSPPVTVRVAQPSPGPDIAAANELPALRALPGSNADPAHPQIGDVFVNPVTGQRIRAVPREDAGKYQPAFPDAAYSSSAASP